MSVQLWLRCVALVYRTQTLHGGGSDLVQSAVASERWVNFDSAMVQLWFRNVSGCWFSNGSDLCGRCSFGSVLTADSVRVQLVVAQVDMVQVWFRVCVTHKWFRCVFSSSLYIVQLVVI